MSHDFIEHDQQYTSDNLVRLPEPESQPDPLAGIDSAFVFDFASYDEPDDDRQRWTTWSTWSRPRTSRPSAAS